MSPPLSGGLATERNARTMDLNEWLASVDLTDPAVLRQLPGSILVKVRPDLLWSCVNCLMRQPSAEYRQLMRPSVDDAGEAAAAAAGGEPEECEDCGTQCIVRGADDDEEELDLAELITCRPCGGASDPRSAQQQSASTAVVYDARMLAHDKKEAGGSVHPERPDRLRAIRQHLSAVGLWQRCDEMAAREATAEELELIHSAAHCRTVKGHCEREEDFRSDTYAVERSYEAALLSCGSVVEMAVAVAEGRHRNGFALVRPPGHHAEPPHPQRSAAAIAPPPGADEMIAMGRLPWAKSCCGAMGFCLFNNVAVAARAAQRRVPGCKKVLIVDWDVHHGNGTQTPFIDDPTVLYFSAHRFDGGQFYPGGPAGGPSQVGEDAGVGYNVNIGWPHEGMGDAEYAAAWYGVLLPIATQFQPDLVLVSAGFDAAEGDPLGGCAISPGGFAMMTSLLMGLAGGKLVLALEGGYNLRSISHSSAACVATMLGDPAAPAMVMRTDPEDDSEVKKPLGPMKGARRAIRRTRKMHAKHWASLCALDDDESDAGSAAEDEPTEEEMRLKRYGMSSSDSEESESESADAGAAQAQASADAAASAGASGGGDGGEEDEEETEHVTVHGRKRPRVDPDD